MPTYYDSNGKPYVLNTEIGRGGEGTVFYCPDDPGLVAKIYHEPIDAEKAEKLYWMAANKNDHLLKVAAWIVDTLHHQNGSVVGFLMPNVKAKEIHELYSLKSRRVHFPEATWQFLLHTAANVARAFYVLHKNDHIMGDVNHGNLVVLADGRVTLIDCDSYSIKTDKMRYRCEVGVATHLAPELQGIDLSEVEREQKHDNFGLAVIIFQLLFLGRHPFAGNYLGAEDKSLEDCIREHRFAYGSQIVTNVKQPPGTLSLSQISLRLARMFTEAFMTANRPEPREWIEALEDLSNKLKICDFHIGHHYFADLTECPWCRIESKTGLMLFPFTSNGNSLSGGKFNILTVENLVNQMLPSQNLPFRPTQFQYMAQPSLEVLTSKSRKRRKLGKIVLAQIFGLFVLTLIFGGGLAFFFGIIITLVTAYIVSEQHKLVRNEFEDKFKTKQTAWNYIETEWKNFNSSAEGFSQEISKIRQQINEYRNLQEEKAYEMKLLSNEAYQYQLRQYLDAFKLADLKDQLVERIHYEIFERYHLKTAADIDEPRLQSLLAINVQIKLVLLQWRKDLERKFKFDINEHLPVAAKNRLEFEFNDKRDDIESNIERMLNTLRSTSTSLQQTKHKLANSAEKTYREVIQAQRDLFTIGGSAALTVLMIFLTIFVPIFSSVFTSFLFGPQRKTKTVYAPTAPRVAPDRVVPTGDPSPARIDLKDDDYYQVNEKITDQQLAEMSAVERERSARVLHKEALKLIDARDYRTAERKLRLAVKYVDYYVNILYTLGSLLYDQKQHGESVKFLEKSLIIDPENENAKLLIGANYMNMGKSQEAKDIFWQVAEKNPQSFEAHFNLGKIYKNRGDYDLARISFEKALKIKSNDTDSHYEYGICLYKLGDWEGAKEQYQYLSYVDEKKAEQLWQIMTKKFSPRKN